MPSPSRSCTRPPSGCCSTATPSSACPAPARARTRTCASPGSAACRSTSASRTSRGTPPPSSSRPEAACDDRRMTDSPLGRDLMAGPPPTLLPVDPAADELAAGDDPHDVVRRHPESPLAWAALAEAALADGSVDDVTAYAYARVGYHRSLDLLRRNGWKGHGPVPWEHEPNRGFLRALAALTEAAGRIGEDHERDRCEQFLRDSSPEAFEALR